MAGHADGALRDVQARDGGAELRQQDGIFALAAADVEDAFPAQVAEQVDAEFLGEDLPAVPVALDDLRVDAGECLLAFLRPAVEELGFLRKLGCILHGRSSRRRAMGRARGFVKLCTPLV